MTRQSLPMLKFAKKNHERNGHRSRRRFSARWLAEQAKGPRKVTHPQPSSKKKSHTTSGTKKNNKSRNVDPSPNPITGREPITKSFFSRLPAFFFSLLALSFFLFDRRISPSLSDQSDWTIKRRATETMEKAKKMNSNVESQKKKTKKKDKRMCRAVQSILSQKSIQNGVGTREGVGRGRGRCHGDRTRPDVPPSCSLLPCACVCVCALPWRPDASRRASVFFAALCACALPWRPDASRHVSFLFFAAVCVCVDFQGYSFDSEAYWAIRIFSFLFFLHFLSDPRLSLGRESNVWKQQQQQKKPASHRFITQPVLPPFPSTFIPLSLSLFLFVYWSIRLVCASIMRDLNSVKNDFGFHGDQ